MKTLSKEVPFGTATAIITVRVFTEQVDLDGYITGKVNVLTTTNVKVVKDGNVIDEAYFANVSGYESNPRYFEKMGLSKTDKLSRVGTKAITMGAEAAEMINAAIKEMEAILLDEMNVESEETKERNENIKTAKEIIALAEKEGIDNLMTKAEIKAWRKRYNELHNEGGEGYIPLKVSREDYESAKSILINQ